MPKGLLSPRHVPSPQHLLSPRHVPSHQHLLICAASTIIAEPPASAESPAAACSTVGGGTVGGVGTLGGAGGSGGGGCGCAGNLAAPKSNVTGSSGWIPDSGRCLLCLTLYLKASTHLIGGEALAVFLSK